jgi:enoyl-CoA hydratase
MTAAVLYDQQAPIVLITLHRPEALNAINRQLRQELAEAIRRYDQDDTARVAIITGAGRAFCAGRDLKERAADNAAGIQARASDSLDSDTLRLFPRTWKPLIAAINGYAMAGGWAIAQMCDLRLAAADAMMGISEARWSLLPPLRLYDQLLRSEDAREGPRAFAEKRQPQWQGR